MDGDTIHHRSSTDTTAINLDNAKQYSPNKTHSNVSLMLGRSGFGRFRWWVDEPSYMKWTMYDVWMVLMHHPILCLLLVLVLFFMGVEYTLRMVPSSSPPFDIGFVATVWLHGVLANRPVLNTALAGINTVFVGMQTVYLMGTWVVEGRPRAIIATLLMFTFRGLLGYSTQLPLPQEFLGSGIDFPVGNVSFFLFYSGHVAASVIASLDMRRTQRLKLAFLSDVFNVLQVVRLLSTRGHYTIDLIVGIGAATLFDSMAETYIQGTRKTLVPLNEVNLNCNGHCNEVNLNCNGHCKDFSNLKNGTR